jgi:hypothetical protein
MRRIGLLLIPFLLFLAACGSGGATVSELPGNEAAGNQEPPEQPTAVTEAQPATESTAEAGSDAATIEPAAGSPDDPTLVRDRDWKLGDTLDPAVTIIEYGDFQ